jgi:GT2 family glycosyltransferase
MPAMSAQCTVSAVIVNWNGAHHLRICLPSLLEQSYKALEIIVVDNASADDSENVAREHKVRWLGLRENVGLAPALNRGAEIATGELLLFVNNDMRFDKDFVTELVAAMANDEAIFATDATQYFWDGTGPGHSACQLTKAQTGRASETELVPGLYFKQHKETRDTEVLMASAACMLARRSYFAELGGFDARLPLGYEDVEICWRAWTKGWKTVYAPKAICWHRVGSSGKSQEGMRYNFRGVLTGRLLFSTKLLPWRYVLKTWAISLAALAKDAARGRWAIAAERMRILWHMTGLLPRLLREKRELFRRGSPENQLQCLLRLANDHGEADGSRSHAQAGS